MPLKLGASKAASTEHRRARVMTRAAAADTRGAVFQPQRRPGAMSQASESHTEQGEGLTAPVGGFSQQQGRSASEGVETRGQNGITRMRANGQ